MRTMRGIAKLFCAASMVGAAACAEAPVGDAFVAVETSQAAYAAAPAQTPVPFWVMNATGRELLLPACGSTFSVTVERRTDGTWADHSGDVCIAIATGPFRLQPGHRAERDVRVAGTGRFRIRLEYNDGGRVPERVYSNEFTIE